ncbi:MAG: MFS transporter [Firmicutes bacterium]|nr:MFS transporter [Bacillota bacterium]
MNSIQKEDCVTRTIPHFRLALVIFSLTGQVAWVVENMYFNVFIYKMFHADAAAISAMVAASAVAATLTTILIGALSDKIGKRKFFMCWGYILWGLSIACFALIRMDVITGMFPAAVSAASIGVTLVILMDCVMTFFGSSANDAAYNAWLTDATEGGGRGAAEGINSMMPLVAILVVFGGFMGFDLDKPSSWTAIFLIIGGIVLVIGILGFRLVTETGVRKPENERFWYNISYGFRPSVMKANPVLYLTLGCFIIFNISIQVFMPYLILYYNVALELDNYVLIMAPAIIVAAVVTAFYGRVYDRLGFGSAILPSLGMLFAGYLMLLFFRQIVPVFIGSLLMLSGFLTGMAVFGAMIRDYTPAGRAGMFQGLRIVCQVLLPGIIGPYIGAAVLKDARQILNDDGTYSFVPNQNIFLAALVVGLILLAALLPLLRRLRRGQLEVKA